MAERIQLRRDTAAAWALANPVLADGEIGFERDTGRLKVGDGVQNWNAIAYSFQRPDVSFVYEQSPASDVWTINHALGKYPSVTVVDSAGDEVEGNVNHVSVNQVVLTFSAAFSGRAFLN